MKNKDDIIHDLNKDCEDYLKIITTQDQIIRELMCENSKYKSLYEKHRAETDADCWGVLIMRDFEVGDKVEILEDNGYFGFDNRFGVVVPKDSWAIDDFVNVRCNVCCNKQQNLHFKKHQLKLLEDVPVFKVGDTVKCIDNNLLYNSNLGKIGVITKIVDNYHYVSLEDDTTDYGIKEDFELVPFMEQNEEGLSLLKKFTALQEEYAELYELKNNKYGDSFGISVRKYGLISALTRMSDKWNRIENLILNEDDGTDDESLIDSLGDLSNYCLMTIMEIQGRELE